MSLKLINFRICKLYFTNLDILILLNLETRWKDMGAGGDILPILLFEDVAFVFRINSFILK